MYRFDSTLTGKAVSFVLLGLLSPLASASNTVLSIGSVDQPFDQVITTTKVIVSGWALHPLGVDRVQIKVDSKVRSTATLGIERPDVAAVHPALDGARFPGFEGALDLEGLELSQHDIEIEAVDKAGGVTVLGHRSYVPPSFRSLWEPLLQRRGRRPNDVFSVALATSGLKHSGNAAEIFSQYTPYLSDTMRVGIRVPILYMRTTLGVERDWEFDPEFDTTRMCGTRRIADDSLNDVIRWSTTNHIPVLFTLNGGIWADASCDVPEWDINDHLEATPENCQWNERNEVMPDDYLRNLPGSQDAPDLARALTLNVYATDVRRYKRRNLKRAVALIREFANAHSELFIGISLDPDVVITPFFAGAQWYDYNPGTLRQFRDWLSSTGPYSGNPPAGQPNLLGYRRPKALTLSQVSRIAGASFPTWNSVEPPRDFAAQRTHLQSEWATIWEQFRRHLVDLHYDELSHWVAEEGIKPERIFSAQGFHAPSAIIGYEPFPVRVFGPPKGYDTGGVSVEGAVPAHGHLGAVIYGDSAINLIPMEPKDSSLFRVFRDFDPTWAAVEYNTAALEKDYALVGPSAAYRGIRELLNYGATLVSPMAWNGSPGWLEGQPGFVAYTAYRGTALETAIRRFFVARANLPLQARFWGFGLGLTADDDSWEAIWPSVMQMGDGHVDVRVRKGRTVIDSPSELDFKTRDLDLLIVAMHNSDPTLEISVHSRYRGSDAWQVLIPFLRLTSLRRDPAGLQIPLPHRKRQIEQIRLVLKSKAETTVRLERVVLYPAGRQMSN